MVRLRDVVQVERDGVNPRTISPGMPYVGLEHINGDGSFINRQTVQPGDLASTKFAFSDRHVLFGKLRPYLRKIARPDFCGICSTDIVPISPSENVDRNYLYHFLRTDAVIDRATSMASGINLPRINPNLLIDFEIPLPPLDEQRRIAAILDQADALRRKRGESLQQLILLKEAIFVDMFVRDESDTWPKKTIAQIAANTRTGPFGSQLLHSEFVDEGIAVLGIDNAVNNEFCWNERRYITPEKYRELRRYTVLPGDVLITIMGTCGRCAIVPADIPTAINTKHLCCITLDQSQAVPEFVQAAFLQHPGILRQLGLQAKGAVMPGLNMGIIRELELPIPPLELQREFARRIQIANDMQSRCRDHLQQLDSLFASLQHRAFRGEL